MYLKPFLIPALIPIAWTIENNQVRRLLTVSLFFSFLGDVFLILEGQLFFILGLVSFLLAHIFYITLSLRFISLSIHFKLSILTGLFFFLYLISFLRFLAPYLGELLIPVIIYALVLAFFGMIGCLIYLKHRSVPSLFLMFGSLFFIASDSLLASATFVQTFSLHHFWVMLTYLIAQYCIVFGFSNNSISSSKF